MSVLSGLNLNMQVIHVPPSGLLPGPQAPAQWACLGQWHQVGQGRMLTPSSSTIQQS